MHFCLSLHTSFAIPNGKTQTLILFITFIVFINKKGAFVNIKWPLLDPIFGTCWSKL